MWKAHAKFERHSLVLLIGIIIVVSIGGLVEISPLFYLESTIEKVDGVRPYTPSSRPAATSTSVRAATAATRR